MTINIAKSMQVKDLKKQFHISFPYLKIELFGNQYRVSGGSSKNEMLDNEIKLETRYPDLKEGSLDYNEKMIVKDFEHKFSEQFDLNVQVFRKSGKVYLETTKTDNWTLKQENDEGLLHSGELPDEGITDGLDRDKWE